VAQYISAIKRAVSLRRRRPAILYAFDLLQLDGADLRKEPIEQRKAMLAKLLQPKQSGIVFNEHIEGLAQEIFEHACKLGYEGIVCKRIGSRYASGRSVDWVKLKNPECAAVRRERKIKR
jgi:bifunctional non-homologous end joining protein LigD